MKVCDCCKGKNVIEYTLPILMNTGKIGIVRIELCESCAKQLSEAYFNIARKYWNQDIHGTYLGGYKEGDADYMFYQELQDFLDVHENMMAIDATREGTT